MKLKGSNTVHIKSIDELHQTLGFGKPKHPLISVQRYQNVQQIVLEEKLKLVSDLYQLTLKEGVQCKLQYGQSTYDFNEGVLSFFSPQQISIIESTNLFPTSGWLISLHPNFLNAFPLAQKIKEYGFFHYSTNEALIISAEEKQNLDTVFQNIEKEYNLPLDNFSQDVILSNIELLLTYSNRYYNRQFISRKPVGQTMVAKLEVLLTTYFSKAENETLPSAEFIAAELNLSPRYLSDCLKQLTGQSLQQHIHEKLIERAKALLGSTTLSISEIAYQLGFEYPQSFHKLFKNKIHQTPSQYRQLYK